jgi:glycosyltransferase involved in cell wall biosynthesis
MNTKPMNTNMTELRQSPDNVSNASPSLEISDPAVFAKIPLVSVKMMTYNHEPYITQAIEGVLQQKTSFPIELVIGEDCSTDRTREIILNFQKKFRSVIRVITSEKNVGARNNSERTRKACRGKYVAFCEGDDYWQDRHKLKKQVDHLEGHPECGLVYSSYDVYHCKQNKTIRDFIRYRKWNIIENPKLSDYFGNIRPIGGNRVGILTCTVIVRKNLYDQIVESDPYLYNDEHFLMGDIQLWAEFINLASVHYIPESMSTYRVTEESATRSKDMEKVARFKVSVPEIMIYLCKKYNLPSDIRLRFEENRNSSLLNLAFHTMNEELAEELMKTKDRWSYLELLKYYSIKNILLYKIFYTAWKCKNLFPKKYRDWW